jgi:hypothetical protein
MSTPIRDDVRRRLADSAVAGPVVERPPLNRLESGESDRKDRVKVGPESVRVP